MQLITLDIETYFDSDYSLKKLTTEAYIRDPRFKVHCMGFISSGESGVVDEPRGLRCAQLRESAILCHHAQFDGLILSHHYNVKPAFWFDTLSMARLALPHLESHSLEALAKHFGLSPKTVPYNEFKGVRDLPPDLYNKLAEGCKHDVELTYSIFRKLLPGVPQEELRVIDATIRMFTEPVLELDSPRMQAYLAKTQKDKTDILAALGVTRDQLQSSARFAEILESLGVAAPNKTSPKGNTIFAFAKTDEGMKQLLEHENETVAALAAARLGEKSTLGETRATALLGMSSRGALCVYLKYCGAHTTRWSGGDSLNWQNFTRGSEIRQSVLAPAGHQLVIIDLAQIEFRVAMWLAGQSDVLALLAEGADVYCKAASDFYGREITKADKEERRLFKTVLLGAQYGMGAAKFAEILRQQKLEGDAAQLIRHYRRSYYKIPYLWNDAGGLLPYLHAGADDFEWRGLRITGKRIFGPNGTSLDYSNLAVEGGEYVTVRRKVYARIWGGKLTENTVQWLARIILSQAMLKIIGAGWRVALTVHDELVMIAPTARAQECLRECLEIMKAPVTWAPGLPLDAEGFISERYSK